MIDLSNIKNYYIACGYTDLRRGIDGLAQIVILEMPIPKPSGRRCPF